MKVGEAMKNRNFARTGRRVSEIGLGTWQLGGSWGEVSEKEATSILQTAIENGVTFVDTADIYGNGRSERLIGEYLKANPSDVFVATKLGRASEPGGAANLTLDAMKRHTEGSLQRLGVEAIDLTQLHCVSPEALQQGDVFDGLRTLQKEGKIKEFGASVESMDEALICLEQDGLASLQIIFNIFRQKPIDVLFDAAKNKGVALIVRLPLASGLLSGKFTKDTEFAPDDHRNFNRDGQSFNVGETFAGLPFEKGVKLADTLKTMVPEGMTMPQFALRWILDHDAVTTVIPGASNRNQVLSNVSGSKAPTLGAELHAKLRELYEAEIASYIRGPY
jgi:aryl-alcohol dehydrogenase-like predicted oxidoreductase